MNLDFGGLRARGGAGDLAANLQGTRGLQWNAAAPRLSFKPQLPAAGTHLLNAAGYVGEGEWTLFIAGFEVDAAFVEFNFLQMGAGGSRALRAVCNFGSGGC